MSNDVFPSLIRGPAFHFKKTQSFATIIQAAASKAETRIAQMQNPVWMWELPYTYLTDDPTKLSAGLSYTDFQTIMGFYGRMQGPFESFLYSDPDDHSVGPAMISGSPNPAAILQVVDDGLGNYYSPIQRNLGGEFYEDITDLNGLIAVYANGTLKTLTTHYTVGGPGLALPNASFAGLYVAWVSPAAWLPNHNYSVNDEILDPAGHIQKVTYDNGSSGSTEPDWDDEGGTTDEGSPVSLTWEDQGYNPGPDTPVTAAFDFYFRVRFMNDEQQMEQWLKKAWGAGGDQGGDPIKLITARVPAV